MIVRFLVGLAALAYTLGQLGPVGWAVLILGLALLSAVFLSVWPLLLVLAIVLLTLTLGRWAGKGGRT